MTVRTIVIPRKQTAVSVTTGTTFVTISDVGNLKHSDVSDVIGTPIFDGADAGDYTSTYAEIINPSTLQGIEVLAGLNAGNRIFGRARAGGSTSPDSVEIEFRSVVKGADLSTSTSYTWEGAQVASIDVYYGFRVRIDTIKDDDLRYLLVNGVIATPGATGGGGGGITESQHRSLRHLIHFIDNGPAGGFVSGAFREIIDTPFPSQIIWWTDSFKTDKIVELTITRASNQNPITEEWKMYNTDGSTILETVTDTIIYNGPFEIERTRTIA
jgi:hypothetical protein